MTSVDRNVSAGSWWPVAFARDLPTREPTRVEVDGVGFALVHTEDGWRAFVDRCPHRAARLSDGRLRPDGRLECLYHGWQFGADGACESIPQLPEGSPIPARACLTPVAVREVQGLLFLWPGSEPQGTPDPLPGFEGCGSQDFVIDLPYDADSLIENVLDVAHIHVAHDGAPGGGRRELAGPIDFGDMETFEDGGFVVHFETRGGRGDRDVLEGARLTFRPPSLVLYEPIYREPSRRSGLALHALRQGPGRCRLLYRSYSSRMPSRPVKHRDHVALCALLEQDMAVVRGQSEEHASQPGSLAALWLPLKTSDVPVLEFRAWIDRLLSSPDAQGGLVTARRGLRTHSPGRPAVPVDRAGLDRFEMHTRHCAACRRRLARARRFRPRLELSAFLLLAGAVLAGNAAGLVGGGVLVGLALICRGGVSWCGKIEGELTGVHPPQFRAIQER